MKYIDNVLYSYSDGTSILLSTFIGSRNLFGGG